MLASRFGERATLKREQDWVVTYRSAGAEEGWNAISYRHVAPLERNPSNQISPQR